MMQTGDYKRARLYYSEAISNLKLNMLGVVDDDEKHNSVA